MWVQHIGLLCLIVAIMASSCSSISKEDRQEETIPSYILRQYLHSVTVEIVIVRHEGCSFFRDLFCYDGLQFRINTCKEDYNKEYQWQH